MYGICKAKMNARLGFVFYAAYPHCFWAPGTARHLRPLRTTNQPHPKLLCYGHFEAYIFHIYRGVHRKILPR
jgi:hypothetical protein